MRALASAAAVLGCVLSVCAATAAGVRASSIPAPLQAEVPRALREGVGARAGAAGEAAAATARPSLHGRFLHVTDMHPDQFYTYNGTVESSCQLVGVEEGDPEAEVRAGYWGTPRTECDSPVRLVERPLQWAAQSFAGPDGLELDFIIWTGDNVRHDTGPVHPRTRDEIFEFNKWCILQLKRAFPGVPIVPAIGNNDIYPHNIMWPGPNDVTFTYARLWSQFGLLPESEAHVCSIGGYFAHDVIPAALTVFSLNTIYWFKSNKMVDGCDSRRGDPGGHQLDWLEAQLDRTRNRGMQAHLIGHVPPNGAWYFADCYQRYTNLVLRFQDTIVGQHYGHQNYDLFTFHTEAPAPPGPEDPAADPYSADAAGHTATGPDTDTDKYESLLYRPSHVGVKSPYDVQGKDIVALMVENILGVPDTVTADVVDTYSVASLSPSLLPNWYPTLRVWTYNTSSATRYRASDYAMGDAVPSDPAMGLWRTVRQAVLGVGSVDAAKKNKRRRKKKHQGKKAYHRHPASPARQNRFLTPLGYSEWHLNLDEANRAYEASPADPPPPEFQLEYATYPTAVLWQEFLPPAGQGAAEGPVPVPKALLDAELARYDQHGHGHGDPAAGRSRASLSDRFVLPTSLRSKTDWEYHALTIDAYLDLSLRLRSSRKNYHLVPPPPARRVPSEQVAQTRPHGPGSARARPGAHTGAGADADADALEASIWGRFMARLYADSGVTVEHLRAV